MVIPFFQGASCFDSWKKDLGKQRYRTQLSIRGGKQEISHYGNLFNCK